MTQEYQRHGGCFKTVSAAQNFIERLQGEHFQTLAPEIIRWEALKDVPSVSTFVPEGGVIVVMEVKPDEFPQIQALVMECMGENLLEEQLNSWGI